MEGLKWTVRGHGRFFVTVELSDGTGGGCKVIVYRPFGFLFPAAFAARVENLKSRMLNSYKALNPAPAVAPKPLS